MTAIRVSLACVTAVMLAGAAMAAPLTAGASLTIVNDTGQAVEFLYIITPQGGWPEDLLEEDVLAAGATYRFQGAQPACIYDVKAVFADGTAVERPAFDICATPQVSLAALLGEDALAGKADGAEAPPPPAPPPPYAISVEPGAIEAAPSPAPRPAINRGVPICPGDVRCKKKP